MNVLFLTKYGNNGASSRLRSYQYIPYLFDNGVSPTVHSLFDNKYLEKYYKKSRVGLLFISLYYIRRLYALARNSIYDMTWIEKELFPWIPFSFERTFLTKSKPYIVDYDDAIYHRYDRHRIAIVRKLLGKKIDRVMKEASLVIAGNDYIGRRAHDAGAHAVEVVPTVIDLRRYQLNPIKNIERNRKFSIGWIGSPSTQKYLSIASSALSEVCREGSGQVVLVGANELRCKEFNFPYVVKPWSEETESEMIREFDVGIMPIANLPWEEGKCGYKLIQYMACRKPVVGSPVGVNKKIITDGVNGFHAATSKEWVSALSVLKEDGQLRTRMGNEGRDLVERKYSLQITAPRILELFRKYCRE